MKFRCARFPEGRASISTAAGIVEFQAGMAEVDDETLAAALRAVPEVFGIEELTEGHSGAAGAQAAPRRPARTAGKEEWVAYGLSTLALSEQQVRAMSKDRLIELTP